MNDEQQLYARRDHGGKTLVVLTNIPTPYRAHFFECLSRELASHSVRLTVAFCAASEWNRRWQYVETDHRYEHRILSGWSLKIGAITFHFNLGILEFLRQERPNWLLSAGSWSMPTGVLALLMRRRQKFITIFWSEGHADAVLNPNGLVAWVRRFILKKYDAFAVPNIRTEDFLCKELGYRPACLRLPNTVDADYYVPATETERCATRKRLLINTEDRVFLQVSQLEDRKGVCELLEAFSLLTVRHPRLKCVVVGTGTKEAALRVRYAKEIATGRLLLCGSLTADGVRDWLQAADFFILASKLDPNPLSPIEAAFCGKPLIISKLAGNSTDLIPDDTTGFILTSISVEAICACALRLLELPKLCVDAMGKQSRENALKKFSPSIAARDFADQLMVSRPQERSHGSW